MLIINCTGTNRTYWVPRFEWRHDGKRTWYASVKVLRVELILYSRRMGAELIRRFNEQLKQPVTTTL